eukprot:4797302-Karenia_brevis.AAC.1
MDQFELMAPVILGRIKRITSFDQADVDNAQRSGWKKFCQYFMSPTSYNIYHSCLEPPPIPLSVNVALLLPGAWIHGKYSASQH